MKEEELADTVNMQIVMAKPEELAKLNVNILARLNGVSAPNLSRAFKKHCAFKLRSYLEWLKIWAFDDIIRKNPGMTVKKALEILDIRSGSHFGQRYKKRRGMTPGEMVLKCKSQPEQSGHLSAA